MPLPSLFLKTTTQFPITSLFPWVLAGCMYPMEGSQALGPGGRQSHVTSGAWAPQRLKERESPTPT